MKFFYFKAIEDYAVFKGRSRRSEFWFFWGINISVIIALFSIAFFTSLPSLSIVMNSVGILFGASMLVPMLAIAVRRLHDTSRSGWWLLMNLIPVAGTIIFLIMMLEDSRPAYNEYGEYPKFVYI